VADLRTEDDEVVLHMSALEKAEGFHGDIRIPLSAVTADDADAVASAIRAATGTS
jgi:hypothetical protein